MRPTPPLTVLALLAGALLAAPVAGPALGKEEKPSPPSPEELRAKLSAALSRLEETGFTARGEVEVRRPARGGAGSVVVAGNLGPSGPPFEGRIVAWLDAEGTSVIASERAIPGFEAYRSAERDVVRLTYEETPPATGTLLNDLDALLDPARLRKELRRADLEAEVDLETGAVVFEGEAPRRLVPSGEAAVLGLPAVRILRVPVRVTLSGGGALTEAEFRVVRSDPLAALIRRGGGLGGGLGGPAPGPGPGKETEGATTVYRLSFSGGEPPPRLTAFRRSVEKMLREGK